MTTAPQLPPAYHLIALDSVGSTNEEAKRLARAGAADGTLVWAREQTAGRGRSGRGWASPPGNLYLSLVLRPDCTPAAAAQLGFVAALGVGGAIGAAVPPLVELRYKWPNDVLLGGGKVSGILLETEGAELQRVEWIVLGLGLNIASHPEGTEFPATSLKRETGEDLAVTDLLEGFARHFLAAVNRWLEDGFGPIRQAWRARAHALGDPLRVRLPRETLKGRFLDLDDTGALVLGLASGEQRRITAGDVFF